MDNITFLRTLANGINPFTGEKANNDSILNDVDVIREIFNISNLFEGNSKASYKSKKDNFYILEEEISKVEIENKEVTVTDFINTISKAFPDRKKLKYNDIYDILLKNGYLTETIDEYKNSKKRIATDKATDFGMRNVMRTKSDGIVYSVVMYNPSAQHELLKMLSNSYL